jgi:hypothetical protein
LDNHILSSKPSGTDTCIAVSASGEGATTRQKPFDQNAEEGVMRSTRVRMLLENLESRALLTTYVAFDDMPVQVVSDKVGTVNVNVGLWSNDTSAPTAETVTLTTSGVTAVPGVDYTPVQQTITLTPANPRMQVTIPVLSGPASLGTRTLQVSVSPSPGTPQGHSEFIVITHGTDTTPPYVVNSQALTEGGKVVAFSVQFSKPMAIGPVTNLANYAIAAPSSLMEIGALALGGSASFSKNIPLKSAIYDAATDTVYLVPVNKVKPVAFHTPLTRHLGFVVEPPSTFEANLQVLKATPTSTPAIAAAMSNLTDTSGNPIASGDSSVLLPTAGSFAAYPSVAKASPSVLSYLFGTPTHATPKAKPKPTHKAN